MLGWEFPPHFAGGVGIVAAALARSLSARGVMVDYVVPTGMEEFSEGNLRLMVADERCRNIRVARLPGQLTAYADLAPPRDRRDDNTPTDATPLYGSDLRTEMSSFAARLVAWVEEDDVTFDVIHAHDWTTFPAALALQDSTGKPVVLHVHITEFDKTGGSHADPTTFDIERRAMNAANRVIAVSDRIRDRCAQSYGVPLERIRVVHNAVDPLEPSKIPPPRLGGSVVLFLGRITLQKGPDHFLEAARLVAERLPDVRFVMAGTGDLLPSMIERAAELGIGAKTFFPGFVDRDQVGRLLDLADVFVMPSVSEPFGIVAVEAQRAGVPVIVSRQSGASEVMSHAFKADFWNAHDVAGKIMALLEYPPLAEALRAAGPREASQMNGVDVSAHVMDVYQELVH